MQLIKCITRIHFKKLVCNGWPMGLASNNLIWLYEHVNDTLVTVHVYHRLWLIILCAVDPDGYYICLDHVEAILDKQIQNVVIFQNWLPQMVVGRWPLGPLRIHPCYKEDIPRPTLVNLNNFWKLFRYIRFTIVRTLGVAMKLLLVSYRK